MSLVLSNKHFHMVRSWLFEYTVHVPLDTDVTDGVTVELVMVLDDVSTIVDTLGSLVDNFTVEENICTTVDETDLVGDILFDDVLDVVLNTVDVVLNTVDVVLNVVVSNMMGGMAPLIALPRGVVKSRLTALAV